MASLQENIQQAVADFDSIKTAIEAKGVPVGNVATSEYANLIEMSGGMSRTEIIISQSAKNGLEAGEILIPFFDNTNDSTVNMLVLSQNPTVENQVVLAVKCLNTILFFRYKNNEISAFPQAIVYDATLNIGDVFYFVEG